MNINISDPTPKTGVDVSAAYQAGYNQYPVDHPPVDGNNFYSLGYADGYANYPISNPVHITYFLTILNNTPSHLFLQFKLGDAVLIDLNIPPFDYYIHDISEMPQPVHLVAHTDVPYKIDTLYWLGDDGGGFAHNGVTANTIDMTSEFFTRQFTQTWT